uniref:DUF968 domain-containing protein n=1 Tax=Marinobacterium profundum TaxID=1714300 RepID=UPI00082C42FF|nr:DUF968 domain-containing protein [Marinobacterium profundum]
MIKPKAYRSTAYIKHLKAMRCICCNGSGGDPHHVIGLPWGLSGMGMTAPDSFAMPMCRGHHSEVHRDVDMQQQQPEWLLWTLQMTIPQFAGELQAQLIQAQAFVERKMEAA